MNRRICVVTGTRAEYGLLRWIMEGIVETSNLELQLIVTGMHLTSDFGNTYQEIESDGFIINRKIEMLLSSDTSVAVAKSMGLGIIGVSEALQQLEPDLMLVLGDRFEIFSAVSAAMLARVPVAHLHGGEATEGLIDESIRHSITKMSQLHFVAAEEYQNRVIQLGEQPERVFLVGGVGIDGINKLSLLSRSKLEKSLELKFSKKNLLITFHPVTLENSTAAVQMTELLNVLALLEETQLIFTMPNADAGGRVLFEMIEQFVSEHANAQVYTSLGQLRYLSCIQFVDGVIGNSSSGLLEVPSFKKGTVNIGDRQRGRIMAKSVINCSPNKLSISTAIKKLYSNEFQDELKLVSNPYGDGGASKRVVDILSKISFEDILKKQFFDIVKA